MSQLLPSEQSSLIRSHLTQLPLAENYYQGARKVVRMVLATTDRYSIFSQTLYANSDKRVNLARDISPPWYEFGGIIYRVLGTFHYFPRWNFDSIPRCRACATDVGVQSRVLRHARVTITNAVNRDCEYQPVVRGQHARWVSSSMSHG